MILQSALRSFRSQRKRYAGRISAVRRLTSLPAGFLFFTNNLPRTPRAFGLVLLAYERRAIAAGGDDHPGPLRRLILSSGGVSVTNYRYLHMGQHTGINRGSYLDTPRRFSKTDGGGIWIGNSSYVGRRVLLEISPEQILRIGDCTTINDNSIVLGDVRIESFSSVAPHVYMSSGTHHTTVLPEWLMRDQDSWVLDHPELNVGHNNPIHIEEDVWIGCGVFVHRGVYIGRGAVIGAHTVVTRDVPPYSVQFGDPNRAIAKRLEFQPPPQVSASQDKDLPYFYAGFGMQQKDISLSRTEGVIFAKSQVRLVLQGGAFDAVSLSGRLNGRMELLELKVSCNGQLIGSLLIKEAAFSRTLRLGHGFWSYIGPEALPSVLRAHNQLELEITRSALRSSAIQSRNTADYMYGLSSVSLHFAGAV